jgi:glycosyltransferase involved in cell wall biosynthesis
MVRRMVESCIETAERPDALEFALVWQQDDETRHESLRLLGEILKPEQISVNIIDRSTVMKSGLWNKAVEVAHADVLLGGSDDMIFRTKGWDRIMMEALSTFEKDGIGMVWGDDGSPGHGRWLHTTNLFYRRLFDALGYLYPDYWENEWMDNWLTEIMRGVGRTIWLPDLLIEHMHPYFGKASMDETYQASATTAAAGAEESRIFMEHMPEFRAAILRLVEAMDLETRPYIPRVSACMIVKNEEAVLPRALASLVGKVDEIIVVDTGSTDKTIAVAESYGARVFTFEWTDSFADARNFALEHATGDWILSIDADEQLGEGQRVLRNILIEVHEAPVDGMLLPLGNINPADGTMPSRSKMLRLFRKNPDLRWEFRIHENLAWADGRDVVVGEQPWVGLVHTGYMPQVADQSVKMDRNVRLLELQLADAPDHPFHIYNLAREYWARGTREERLKATPLFAQAIVEWRKQARYVDGKLVVQGFVADMFMKAISNCILTGEFQQAIEIGQSVLEEIMTPEIAYALGCAWRERARELRRLDLLDTAIPFLMRAWQDETIRANSWDSDLGAVNWKPWVALAECYAAKDEWTTAHAFVTRAVMVAPMEPSVHRLLAEIAPHVLPEMAETPELVTA